MNPINKVRAPKLLIASSTLSLAFKIPPTRSMEIEGFSGMSPQSRLPESVVRRVQLLASSDRAKSVRTYPRNPDALKAGGKYLKVYSAPYAVSKSVLQTLYTV